MNSGPASTPTALKSKKAVQERSLSGFLTIPLPLVPSGSGSTHLTVCWSLQAGGEFSVEPHQERSFSFTVSSAGSGSNDQEVHVLTADISGEDLDLREWCEGLVKIKP